MSKPYRTDTPPQIDVPPDAISVRDVFAAAALTGLLAQGIDTLEPTVWAAEAYRHADAMMTERARS